MRGAAQNPTIITRRPRDYKLSKRPAKEFGSRRPMEAEEVSPRFTMAKQSVAQSIEAPGELRIGIGSWSHGDTSDRCWVADTTNLGKVVAAGL